MEIIGNRRKNAFLTSFWRFLISNELEKLEFILEKNVYWDLETYRTSQKIVSFKTILISCKMSFHSWLWIIRQYIHIYVCRRSKVAREPNLPSAYVTSVYFESSASLFPSHPQINTGAAHRTLVLAKARDKKYIGLIENC